MHDQIRMKRAHVEESDLTCFCDAEMEVLVWNHW